MKIENQKIALEILHFKQNYECKWILNEKNISK